MATVTGSKSKAGEISSTDLQALERAMECLNSTIQADLYFAHQVLDEIRGFPECAEKATARISEAPSNRVTAATQHINTMMMKVYEIGNVLVSIRGIVGNYSIKPEKRVGDP